MELTEVKAIDTMCRAGYAGIVTEEEWKETWNFYESQACVKGTFGGVLKKLGVPAEDGWKVVASQYKPSVRRDDQGNGRLSAWRRPSSTSSTSGPGGSTSWSPGSIWIESTP